MSDDLDTQQLRGQTYDGLSVLQDHKTGIAKQILLINPKALSKHCLNHSLNLILQVRPDFFVKLYFEIAVDQQIRAHDQTFEGVPDSGYPPVSAGQLRPYLVNFCQITLTCSQPCFGVLYL